MDYNLNNTLVTATCPQQSLWVLYYISYSWGTHMLSLTYIHTHMHTIHTLFFSKPHLPQLMHETNISPYSLLSYS